MLGNVRQILKARGYQVYDKPWQLNIVAFRSRFVRSNAFDDWLVVFYKNDKNRWVQHRFACTTDPGQYWLDNPSHPQGTAFLKAGQYVDCYAMGFHRGQYEALVQVKPVTVIRDYNRHGLFNWFESGYEDRGLFGINVHRVAVNGSTVTVDNSSAGCVVLASPVDYNFLMRLAGVHKSLYGNRFTLTLIDYRDSRRRMLSTMAWISALGTSAWTVYQLLQNDSNKKHKESSIGFNRKPGGIGTGQMVQKQ